MDPWRGNTIVPASLHRFAYVGGDPQISVDPNGLASPPQLAFGREVEKVIFDDFLCSTSTTLTGRVVDTSISELVGAAGTMNLTTNFAYKAAFGVGYLARPDFASRDQHVIYEIKPLGLAPIALGKITVYLELLNYLDSMATWSAGTADQYTPLGETSVNGRPVTIVPPVLGVISYYETPNWRLIGGAVAGAAALGATLLAIDTAFAVSVTLGVAFL